MRVGVVVLTWNGREDTLACLRALRDCEGDAVDIVLVDNASDDETVDAARESGLANAIVENKANIGFSAGNNVGIDRALARGAEAVFILNNDAIVSPGALPALVSALEGDARAGACSPVLPYASAPERLWFAGALFDPRRAHAGRASPYEQGVPLPAEPVRIDRAVGAAMLVRRGVIEELGAFSDELFFLYEDVEWSLRMRRAGWHVLLVPRARVAHRVAASQGGAPMTPVTAYYGTRNDLEVGRRYGRGRARQLGAVMVHAKQVSRARRGTRLDTLRATLAGAADFHRRRFGPRPARPAR